MRGVLVFAFSVLTSVLAHAETLEVRPDEPIAEFAVPDDWTTTRIGRGFQAISDDKEVYFWIEAYKPAEFDQILAEHNDYWKKQGVSVTGSDQQQHEEDGKAVTITTEHATWKGEPTVLYYVEYHLGLPSQSDVVFTYWASPKGDEAFHKEVGDVLGSLKVTEK